MKTARILSLLLVLATFLPHASAQCPWSQHDQIATPGGPANEYFGYPVAVSGDDAVVGAPADHNALSGSVYVLRRSGSSWSVAANLVPAVQKPLSAFGAAVAISGDWIVVGAPYENAQGFHTGAAYVFARSGGVWTEVAHLVASNAFRHDYFGSAVAIDGTTALIGAYGTTLASIKYNGSAYFFELVGGTWTEMQEVFPVPGGERGLFGRTAALQGDIAVIGAPMEDYPIEDSGAVYVFARGANGWTLQDKLGLQAPQVGAVFGASAALSGNYLLVGAPHYDDSKVHFGLGSVSVFRDMGAAWVQTDEIWPADGALGDYFGFSVALRGHRALIGAHGDAELGFESGAAYVYEFDGSGWPQRDKLHALDAAPGARFGFSAALGMDVALLGGPRALNGSPDPGFTYAFDVPGSPTGYGAGCPGSSATTPDLAVIGCPTAGGVLTLRVQDGTPGARVLVLVGRDQAAIALPNGCEQLVTPIMQTILLPPISAYGTSMATLQIPAAAAPGWTFTFQAFLGDPSVPNSFATSNGVEIVLE